MAVRTVKKLESSEGPSRGSAGGACATGLEVRHLRAFVALVERGSMTAAADALGTAQSTVSEAVAALERAIGTPAVLRRRGSHGIRLTAAGTALLPHARKVLAALEEAQAAVAAADREARGAVGIVANESISTYLLPAVLAQLRRRWPNTRFAVTVGSCDEVREGLDQGRFDLGLRLEADATAVVGLAATDLAAPADGSRVLADVTLVLFAAPEHALAASKAAVSRLRLAAYRIFSSDSSGDFHALLRDYFRADGGPGPRLEPAGSIDAVKRSVIADPQALGVLPRYTLEEELRTGAVRAVSARPLLPRLHLVARPGQRAPASPAAAALVEALQDAP